jgi:phage shock protein A
MSWSSKVWDALTAVKRLEDKAKGLSEIVKAQNQRIDTLSERIIRLEVQMELLMQVAVTRRISQSEKD